MLSSEEDEGTMADEEGGIIEKGKQKRNFMSGGESEEEKRYGE